LRDVVKGNNPHYRGFGGKALRALPESRITSSQHPAKALDEADRRPELETNGRQKTGTQLARIHPHAGTQVICAPNV
jgi:hypothetical protein